MFEKIVKTVEIKKPITDEYTRIIDYGDWREVIETPRGYLDSIKCQAFDDYITQAVLEMENEEIEVESIIPLNAAWSAFNSSAGAGASITAGFTIVGKRRRFHLYQSAFTFNDDRLSIKSDDLKVFRYFKRRRMKVNLVLEKGNKTIRQENVLSDKKIDEQNAEITKIGELKNELVSGLKVWYKIYRYWDDECDIVLSVTEGVD